MLDDRALALDDAESMQQPVAIDLQRVGDQLQPLEVRVLRAPAHDVVDERAVDTGELGDVRGVDAELPGPRLQPVGDGVAHRLVPPCGLRGLDEIDLASSSE